MENTSWGWLYRKVLLLACLLAQTSAFPTPRPPLPPMPGPIVTFRFDESNPAFPSSAIAQTNLQGVESWSGYALDFPGAGPALLALPQIQPSGQTNLHPKSGTIEFWYAPHWTSLGLGGFGPGAEACLLDIGAWSSQGAQGWWSLRISASGDRLQLMAQGATTNVAVLQTPIDFIQGEWHQLALSWASNQTSLYVDGQRVAQTDGLELGPLTSFEGTRGFSLGSDVTGNCAVFGMLEEVFIFGKACADTDVAADYGRMLPWGVLGPITPEEELLQLEQRQQAARSAGPILTPLDACTCSTGAVPHLIMVSATNSNSVTLYITGGLQGEQYEIFRSTFLQGSNLWGAPNPKIAWVWSGHGTNCEFVTLTNQPWPISFYTLGFWEDIDGHGLSRQQELEVSNNVLVNDPSQDIGDDNEGKNTQNESTLAVFGDTVVCAFIDSKFGQPGYGRCDFDSCLDPPDCDVHWCNTNQVRQIGWAVSHDGGLTFSDKGEPPLLQPGNKGFSADPWLSWDRSGNILYLVTNPERPGVYYPSNDLVELFTPVWRSTNFGETWLSPVNGTPGLPVIDLQKDWTDKPTIAVDDYPGTNQGTIYLATSIYQLRAPTMTNLVFYASTDHGVSWNLRARLGLGLNGLPGGANISVGSDHTIYLLWAEKVASGLQYVLCSSTNGGFNFTSPEIATTLETNPNYLPRHNFGSAEDKMICPALPQLLLNASNSSVYILYSDFGVGAEDSRDVYFLQKTNAIEPFGNPIRVNNDTTTNDQWGPMACVKPDGTKLFVAWYDRRNDVVSNHLIEVYGTFVDLPITTSTAFSTNFLISSKAFPPVFAGSMYTNYGEFDPVYPPKYRTDTSYPTFKGDYAGQVGDYDGIACDNHHVWVSWSDGRSCSTNATNSIIRHQTDIRTVRISWPK